MRKHLLIASIAVAAMVPTFALAQQSCEEQERNRRNATVGGAAVGGTIGAAVAGDDDRVAGAVIGGTIGAIIGNQAGRSDEPCVPTYGFYDRNGQWHANQVGNEGARGYYDREGRFVTGAPNGYYDSNGRWIPANAGGQAGYYDSNRRWVPVTSSGYYDERGNWIAGASAGYYNNRGQWVPGPAQGYYDSRGVWRSGQAPGRRDANGMWIADPQPGYYDNRGRWHPGPAQGYYDSRGNWVSTGGYNASGGGDNANDNRNAMFKQRIDDLDSVIDRAWDDRILSRNQTNTARTELSNIRRTQQVYQRNDGRLSARETQLLNNRLNRLEQTVRRQMSTPGRNR